MSTPMKSVLITGCSDVGAGSAMAGVFPERGCRVFATFHSLQTMSPLGILSNLKILQLDVTKSSDYETAAKTVSEDTCGSLDDLVNCAAHNDFMPLLDEDVEAGKALYEINVWGVRCQCRSDKVRYLVSPYGFVGTMNLSCAGTVAELEAGQRRADQDWSGRLG
ncbi:hypothetical protein GGR56DRAFT_649349 [Xylariaceae sp. FL0804]|nr:hypothetical protein GGR56DRAFT_649349 [Xylariaceae sp. FL0804]